MGLFSPSREVEISAELTRIARLPTRVWSESEAEQLADDMTAALKTERGTMRLRPVQAVALYEIGTLGGMLGNIPVGGGKTLVSLLTPVVLFAERPLLVIPAKLKRKTQREMEILRQHWKLPKFLRIESYEILGRKSAATLLENFAPDLLIFDEAHRVRNPKAAVTRRVRRWMLAHPETKCVPMTGTLIKRSLHDCAHLSLWSLGKDKSPLPVLYKDLEAWADALDERKGQIRRADPGALQIFCTPEDRAKFNKTQDQETRRDLARVGFRRRFIETPGVVAVGGSGVDSSLSVIEVNPPESPEIEEAFEILRWQWETPDGWTIPDGLTMSRHAYELSLGFYYKWDPRPPEDWLNARRAWHKFVRVVLKHSRTLDSELQVREAYPNEPVLLNWKALQQTFEPNTVPVWINDSVIDWCLDWAQDNKGIVWVGHKHFGARLQSRGLMYYGGAGLSSSGRYIEDHPPGQPFAASIRSNAEGRNLQAWSKSLVTFPPANGPQTEQLLGRTHRPGQEADETSYEWLVGCLEHALAFHQAVADCKLAQMTGEDQKLLIADTQVSSVDEIANYSGPRWSNSRSRSE